MRPFCNIVSAFDQVKRSVSFFVQYFFKAGRQTDIRGERVSVLCPSEEMT